MLSRRSFLSATALALVVRPTDALAALAGPALPEVTVYKDPNCGCCHKWVDHMKANGFKVVAHDTSDMDAVKKSFGVPSDLQSCHTGVVGGYAFEGHVPADVIRKLLAEKPKDIRGVAVPGMPQGSPGMETGRVDHYDIIAFDRAGKTKVYARR